MKKIKIVSHGPLRISQVTTGHGSLETNIECESPCMALVDTDKGDIAQLNVPVGKLITLGREGQSMFVCTDFMEKESNAIINHARAKRDRGEPLSMKESIAILGGDIIDGGDCGDPNCPEHGEKVRSRQEQPKVIRGTNRRPTPHVDHELPANGSVQTEAPPVVAVYEVSHHGIRQIA